MVSVIIILGLDIILSIMDIQSNMLSYLGSPYLIYSDMNGFGPGLTGSLWFNIYWILFGFILLYSAGIFWPRSVVCGFKERIKVARGALDKTTFVPFIGLIGVWILVAGFVFYNTQVLNPYLSGDEREELSAEYEKQLKKYKKRHIYGCFKKFKSLINRVL